MTQHGNDIIIHDHDDKNQATVIVATAEIAPPTSKLSSSAPAPSLTSSTLEKTVPAWGHASCCQPNLPPPPPCRHWIRLGRCPTKEMGLCAFLHKDYHNINNNGDDDNNNFTTIDHDGDGNNGMEMTENGHMHQQQQQPQHQRRRWGGRRRCIRNQHKNSAFRIFLMQTYGMEYLLHGNGSSSTNDAGSSESNNNNPCGSTKHGVIIDVAGGKGELSFELINLSGVSECVVFDPRPLNLNLVHDKWTKGLYEPKRIGPIFSRWYPACEDGCRFRKPTVPRHVRCFFHCESLLQFMGATTLTMNGESMEYLEEKNRQFQNEIERAKRIVWTTKGLQHEDGTSFNEGAVAESVDDYCSPSTNVTDASETKGSQLDGEVCAEEEVDTSEIVDPNEVRDILQRCHLIVGFHPDQAAGDIVDYALATNIPYCIVPCCVYSDTFASRRLHDGTKVTSYDHFVKWLCEKDPLAKMAKLDMDGKNIVIYSLPKSKDT